MRTRLDVCGIDSLLSFAELKQRVEDPPLFQVPVYKAGLDELSGMIHTKDLIPYLNDPMTSTGIPCSGHLFRP